MKERIGFVSNSSSSSFVATFNPKGRKGSKILVEIDLSKFGEIVETVEELDVKFEEHGIDTDGHEYEDCVKALKAGHVVLFGSCDRDGGSVFCQLLPGQYVWSRE